MDSHDRTERQVRRIIRGLRRRVAASSTELGLTRVLLGATQRQRDDERERADTTEQLLRDALTETARLLEETRRERDEARALHEEAESLLLKVRFERDTWRQLASVVKAALAARHEVSA